MRVSGNQFAVSGMGCNAEGEKTSGTVIYTKKDNDTLLVTSDDRMEGGQPQDPWNMEFKRVKE